MTKYVNPNDDRLFVIVENNEIKGYAGFEQPNLASVLSNWIVDEPTAPVEVSFDETRKQRHYEGLIASGWPEALARETAGI